MFQNLLTSKPVQHLSVVCMTVLFMLLGACSFLQSSPPSQEEQAEKLEEAMGKGGYAPARGFSIGSSRDIWKHDGVDLDVMVTAPTAPGSYPLIIYLPTLGEDAAAGQLWRETWAKAGYAVFSMQPVAIGQALSVLRQEQRSELGDMDDGDRIEPVDDGSLEPPEEHREGWFGEKQHRPSRAARNSELRYMGHEYFATDNLKNRMHQLFWAYQQLKIRAGLKQSLFASADLSRVVLAGYELGAQTVSAVLGENFGTSLPSSDELKPLAGILLSPPVNLADGNVHGRFQKLNSPMLAMTGSEDNDAYAISSPLVRTAVWEYAPAGEKYLLLLQAGRHRVFAGSEMGGRFGQYRRDEFDGMPLEKMRSGGGRGSRVTGDAQWNGMMERFPVENGRNDTDLGYKHVAAIFSVSTAFLDVVVKNDSFARSWLDGKASLWLGKTAALKRR